MNFYEKSESKSGVSVHLFAKTQILRQHLKPRAMDNWTKTVFFCEKCDILCKESIGQLDFRAFLRQHPQ